MKFALVAQSMMLYFTRTPEGVSLLAKEEDLLKELLPIVPNHYTIWLVEHLGTSPYPPLGTVLRSLAERHAPILDPLILPRRDAFVNQAANTLRYIEQQRK